MPELPEVETVKNTLKKYLQKRKIISAKVYWDNIIAYPKLNDFINQIQNQNINDILRRGKFLIFELDNYYLLSHLRMEGKYFIKENEAKEKHEHVIFKLDNNKELRYHDTRKFGKMYLIEKEKLYTEKPLKDLGLEPWDKNLTVNYLKDKMKNKMIKTLLLNQNIIAGIGNIYADEILFLSKINPNKKGIELTNKELENIIKNTKTVLEKAIEEGGTTIRSYSSSGVHGRFQNKLLVHTKEKCPTCNSDIIKTVINTRSTYYCPKCQK